MGGEQRVRQLRRLSSTFINLPIPDVTDPDAALYPFWDDLVVDEQAEVYIAVGRGRPALRLGGVAQHGSSPTRPSDEDGTVIYRYGPWADTGLADGNSATIGLENADGRMRCSTRTASRSPPRA
jgi:hypothetical protein